jgi:hypothetical protein
MLDLFHGRSRRPNLPGSSKGKYSMRHALMFATALVFGTLATGAFAETPEERQACQDDAFRVCQAAIPDRERVFACLVKNQRALNPICRKAIAKFSGGNKKSRAN